MNKPKIKNYAGSWVLSNKDIAKYYELRYNEVVGTWLSKNAKEYGCIYSVENRIK